MKRFSYIILTAFIIAQFTYMVFESGVKKFNCFSYERLNDIINGKTNYDLIFFGSSRTQCHVNPCIIDSITKLNSFNAGKAGSNSLEVRMLLEAYLNSHKAPKYVVYNIDNLSVSNLEIVPNSNLYLFFLNNSSVYNYTKSTFSRNYILRYLPFTRLVYFDDYLRNVALQGHFSKTEVLNNINYCKGHASNTPDTIKAVEVVPNLSFVKNADLTHITSIIQLCKAHHIKLIFNSTPVIFKNNKPTSNQHVSQIDSLALAEKIPFIRFDTSRRFDQNDFIDIGHLNRAGSVKFSKLFGNALKNELVN